MASSAFLHFAINSKQVNCYCFFKKNLKDVIYYRANIADLLQLRYLIINFFIIPTRQFLRFLSAAPVGFRGHT
ncbi:hypothetical protein AV903_18145 [Erwinia tracheiphila]|nr:hypothetical protein AV903_18145 [Erwinia tracheiphila]